jgi:hypothetical protein
MERDVEKILEERCDLELQKNKDYINLQIELANAHSANDVETFSEISFRMQNIAAVVSYKLAIKDMYSIINE